MKNKFTPHFTAIINYFFAISFFSISGLVAADHHQKNQREKRPAHIDNKRHDFDHALNNLKSEIGKARERGDRQKVEQLMRRVREMEGSRNRGDARSNDRRGDRRPVEREQNFPQYQERISQLQHQIIGISWFQSGL